MAVILTTTPNYADSYGTGELIINPSLGISPAASVPLNFPIPQLVGRPSVAQYIKLTNIGQVPLLVNVATFEIGAFAISDQAGTCTTGMTLQPARSCVIRVVFIPTSAGPASGFLFIDSAGLHGGGSSLELSGTGLAPTASLTLSTASLIFPASEMVGESSVAQYVQITSTGSAPLKVTSVTVGGANPGDFSVTNQAGTCTTGATLAYHADCNLRVVFAPTAAGTRTATLFINDNVSGSPQQVTVSGTAITGAQLSLSASTLTFPATRVGSTAATEYLTIKSTGFAPLVINQVTLSSGDFTLSSQAGTCTTAATTTLTPGADCNIRVQFHPTATGARTATVVINNNTATSPLTVTLNGTGE
jgi:hypothetical protein